MKALFDFIEDCLVRFLWWLDLVHEPKLHDISSPYRSRVIEVPEEEEKEEDVRPFLQKTFIARAGGNSKAYNYAAYPSEDQVGETICSEWTLEPISLDQEQLLVFAEWSSADDLVLEEKGWNSERRINTYKKIKAAIVSGMKYQSIVDTYKISLSSVKDYGSLVYRAIEYRRQAER